MADNFWNSLDCLIASNSIVVDRPKGSCHPRYPELIYPLDYGYLEGTSSGDGDGIDIWLGASGDHGLSAVILTVDTNKRDTEIKLLLGCSESEIQTALRFSNDGHMRGVLILRPVEET
jgi:inorganic pyrophosphatase